MRIGAMKKRTQNKPNQTQSSRPRRLANIVSAQKTHFFAIFHTTFRIFSNIFEYFQTFLNVFSLPKSPRFTAGYEHKKKLMTTKAISSNLPSPFSHSHLPAFISNKK